MQCIQVHAVLLSFSYYFYSHCFLLISIEYSKAVLVHTDHIESCFHLKYVLISFIDIFCKWHSSDQLIFVCNMWVEHAWCKCASSYIIFIYIYMVEVCLIKVNG